MPRAQLTHDELETMRQRLAEAALAIYREEGLEALSFRRLADAMSLSHTLPYRYFENKDALLAEVRRGCFVRFEAHVRAAEAGLSEVSGRTRAVTAAYVDFVTRWPADYQLMFSTEQPPPDQFPALLQARRALFEHTVEMVADGIEAGLLVGEARQLTHLVWVSIHGLMTLHVANQLVHGYTLQELIEPLIETFLGHHAAADTKPRPRKPARAA